MTDHSPSDTRADPHAAADRTESPTDGSEIADREPTTVLHVEPNVRSAELLEAFARRHTGRIRVRSVDCAADALDAVDAGVEVDGERVAVDCVVTEQRLPDGTGVELAERLRETDPRLPVVFYTTCPSEEGEAAAFGAGADAYFEKGSDRGRYDAILDRIRALVDERRNREKGAHEGGAEAEVASTTRASGSSEDAVRSEE
ncbi:11-domain light and oxygen sensing his kinase [Halorubrum sp. DM2]|uniref:response regulator n=1 Tax=Halorubrum sp. DM2 TaxID=2527867 RepID=UPI0024B648AB|nr:response regulator [Halorubrum sp. DM2]VTT85265.1 11-domain light and oxygen sensing his kinase [Halorubrum sp. DM2]